MTQQTAVALIIWAQQLGKKFTKEIISYIFGEIKKSILLIGRYLSAVCLVTIPVKSNAKKFLTLMPIRICPNCNQTADR